MPTVGSGSPASFFTNSSRSLSSFKVPEVGADVEEFPAAFGKPVNGILRLQLCGQILKRAKLRSARNKNHNCGRAKQADFRREFADYACLDEQLDSFVDSVYRQVEFFSQFCVGQSGIS